MKTLKIILIALFLLQSIVSFGQTKEETIKYIDDVVNVSNGYYGKLGTWKRLIKSQNFSLSKVTIERITEVDNNEKRLSIETYTKIPWSTIKNIKIHEKQDTESSLVGISIEFDNQINVNSENQDFFTDNLKLYVIPSKVKNIEKALKHLQELNKKEDLFGN